MDQLQEQPPEETQPNRSPIEGLLWMFLCFLILAVAITLTLRNWEKIKTWFNPAEIANYDNMIVSNGFHDIRLKNGQSWQLSYEALHERNFTGLVRHDSRIEEPSFSILTHDILVTSGDYANPEKVDTSVSNHHFTWYAKDPSNLQGAINLLHTVPMNEEIEEQLNAIKNGDQVVITGWDILRINGYDAKGNYVGYWEDSGCNTLLVIGVEIIQ
jgi:hypothetical protein